MKRRKIKYKKIFYLCFVTSIMILGITISIDFLTRKVVKFSNPNPKKVISKISSVESYSTEYVYDDKIPSSADPIVITEGTNGISGTETKSVNKVIKVGTGPKAVYTGRMTGYGGDCKGCSGNLSCRTKEGVKFNLLRDGQTYNDQGYGKVRIVAAELSQFPCGTIIKIDNGKLDPFMAIVLDTGYSVKKAWSDGTVWMDLAFVTQSDKSIYNATSRNVEYSVQRWGW